MKKSTKKKGFTLIELIVVIAILGILAAVLIPKFGGFTDKAKATQAMVSAKQVATAIDSIVAEGSTLDETTVGTVSGVKDGAIDNGTIAVTLGTAAGTGASTFVVQFTPTSGTVAYAGRLTDAGKVETLTAAQAGTIN